MALNLGKLKDEREKKKKEKKKRKGRDLLLRVCLRLELFYSPRITIIAAVATMCLQIYKSYSQSLPGTEVPKATKAIALTESLRKMKHPRWLAMSPMTAVLPPINRMEITKVG